VGRSKNKLKRAFKPQKILDFLRHSSSVSAQLTGQQDLIADWLVQIGQQVRMGQDAGIKIFKLIAMA